MTTCLFFHPKRSLMSYPKMICLMKNCLMSVKELIYFPKTVVVLKYFGLGYSSALQFLSGWYSGLASKTDCQTLTVEYSFSLCYWE